jgi:hypothetical protein
MAPKAKSNKNATKKKNEIRQATVSFVDGKYDGRKLDIIYPSPEWLVLSMGTELYRRVDPPVVIEATYKLVEDWSEYNDIVKEQGSPALLAVTPFN